MELAVLVREQPNGMYRARVPAIRGLVVTAPNREQAESAIRCAITTGDPTATPVFIDDPLGPDGQPDPWLETAGMFADDETLEDMLKEIYAARDAERPEDGDPMGV